MDANGQVLETSRCLMTGAQKGRVMRRVSPRTSVELRPLRVHLKVTTADVADGDIAESLGGRARKALPVYEKAQMPCSRA